MDVDLFLQPRWANQLQVRVVPEKSCWVNLPASLCQYLLSKASTQPPVVLRIVPQQQASAPLQGPSSRSTATATTATSRPPPACYVAWAGGACSSEQHLEVPAGLASCLQLRNGQPLRLEVVTSPPIATWVEVEPAQAEDWEVLQLNATALEDSMLSQVGVLSVGQQFCLWAGQACMRLVVTGCKPANLVRLSYGTEVAVAPKERARPRQQGKQQGQSAADMSQAAKQMGDGVKATNRVVQLRALLMPRHLQQPLQKEDSITSALQEVVGHQAAYCTWLTVGAVVHPDTMQQHSLRTLQYIAIRSSQGGRLPPRSLQLVLVPSVCCARDHIMLSPPVLQLLSILPHTMVQVQVGQPMDSTQPASHTSPTAFAVTPLIWVAAEGSTQAGDNSHDLQQGQGGVQTAWQGQQDLSSAQQGQGDKGDSHSSHPSGAQPLLALVAPAAAQLHRSKSEPQQLQHGSRQVQKAEQQQQQQVQQQAQQQALHAALQLWWQCQRRMVMELMSVTATQAQAAALPETYTSLAGVIPDSQRVLLHLHQGASHASGAPGEDFCFLVGAPCRLQQLLQQQLRQQRQPQGQLHQIVCIRLNDVVCMPTPALAYSSRQRTGEGSSGYLHTLNTTACTTELPPHDFTRWVVHEMPVPAVRVLQQVAVLHSSSLARALRQVRHVQPPPKHGNTSWPVGGHLLITGPAGSGKTTMLNGLVAACAADPAVPWHVIHVRCTQLLSAAGTQGSELSSLHSVLKEALQCAPSLLILQSLDHIAPAGGGEAGESSQSYKGAAKTVDDLMTVMKALVTHTSSHSAAPLVKLVATARAARDVAEPLRQAGLFDTELQLQPPGASGRQHMLLHAQQQLQGIQLEAAAAAQLAACTEGYEPAELHALLDRAAHTVAQRITSNSTAAATDQPAQLTAADVHDIVSGYQPPVFWSMTGKQSAGKGTGLEWQDVGGMLRPKRLLLDALVLPLQHAKLAATAPLRLRTGLMLYGPPGCGKTHLVQAAAAYVQQTHNVRFIAVKGPELLNKYIGASEAAVRDLFQRAAAAAPCVLFFDEFDAIAPSRGHDSTGVTDRVVNQLLTELDGVEGLHGVVVLAATSRPDMIDAALLRPGRLDRLVYCGFPKRGERLMILQALGRKMQLSSGVDFKEVAAATEGCTGADLRAILAEAQLSAVHASLSAASAHVTITMDNLREAAARTRPSVTVHERARLEHLFAKFQKGTRTTSERYKAPGLRATQA